MGQLLHLPGLDPADDPFRLGDHLFRADNGTAAATVAEFGKGDHGFAHNGNGAVPADIHALFAKGTAAGIDFRYGGIDLFRGLEIGVEK